MLSFTAVFVNALIRFIFIQSMSHKKREVLTSPIMIIYCLFFLSYVARRSLILLIPNSELSLRRIALISRLRFAPLEMMGVFVVCFSIQRTTTLFLLLFINYKNE